MTDKNTPIEPITHSDERVNIHTPELAPMMAWRGNLWAVVLKA